MIKNCIIFILLLVILLTGIVGTGLYFLNDDFQKEIDDVFECFGKETSKDNIREEIRDAID